jgi:hypothetical protein
MIKILMLSFSAFCSSCETFIILKRLHPFNNRTTNGEGIGSATNENLLYNIFKPNYFEDDKKALQKTLFMVNPLILSVFYCHHISGKFGDQPKS